MKRVLPTLMISLLLSTAALASPRLSTPEDLNKRLSDYIQNTLIDTGEMNEGERMVLSLQLRSIPPDHFAETSSAEMAALNETIETSTGQIKVVEIAKKIKMSQQVIDYSETSWFRAKTEEYRKSIKESNFVTASGLMLMVAKMSSQGRLVDITIGDFLNKAKDIASGKVSDVSDIQYNTEILDYTIKYLKARPGISTETAFKLALDHNSEH